MLLFLFYVISTTRGNVILLTVDKMDPPVGFIPGVKESAKTYLAAKQIPQLFQVADLMISEN